MADITNLISSRHPSYISNSQEWDKWRVTYDGGDRFRDQFLEKFSEHEDNPEFSRRRNITPVPSFAKAAINDIRNSIFQRMRDITRMGGSQKYQKAIAGLNMGVDRRGSTMNAFLGIKVLTELLIMGRVGVYVDNPVVVGETLADSGSLHPYLYSYPVEDVLSWSCNKPEDPSEFTSLLLRDNCIGFDGATGLAINQFQRFRLLWIDKETGKVNLQFYDKDGTETDRDGNPGVGPIHLNLTRIPFVMFDLGDSLIKDVCQHQIALLNLASSDVWYALQSNFPFYVEQRDLRQGGGHLKTSANADGTATSGGQGASDTSITTGTKKGRAYDMKAEQPAFINPSPEPLKVSIQLQEKLEADIRKLVNLAVQSMATRQSAEAKSMDNQGLEAGLSYIGLVLENGERRIAEFWASYENRIESAREVATVKYPDRYSLKTDSDRIDEATKLAKLMFSVPGREVKREIAKDIVVTLLGGRVSVGRIEEIRNEIEKLTYLTSDPDTIVAAVEAGLCGEKTGSQALGFEGDEYLQAREDHTARVKRIAESQGITSNSDPAARGAPDLSANNKAGSEERDDAADPTMRQSRRRRQRRNSTRARVSGSQ